ncbi:ribosomal protein S5-alanine N-acetyltransferase [Vibrio vulnificus]|nr:ribosomal protein S5-alanine N-acetyltransferase [Vibrio vulnificus]
MGADQYFIYQVFEGLVLRTVTVSDAEMVAQYFQRNQTFLKPWEPTREASFFTEAGWAQKLIKLHELHRMKLGFYCILIEEQTNEMVGTISFSNLSKFPFYACNVGYSLAEEAQGKGYMRRGLKMACDYMFEQLNLHRIQAAYMPHNHRSAGVLEHLGFCKEGYAHSYLLIDGQWQDHVLTSLINPNWRAEK